MNNIIKTLLQEWRRREVPPAVDRAIALDSFVHLKSTKIIAITGFRRVGKTYLLFNLINRLLKKKTREELIYLNFEDERIPLQSSFLTALIPTIREFYDREPKFLFLDEVHNVPEWSKWTRRTYDNEKIILFVTGSSSKMSSREIPSELRGRFLEVRVFPLTFSEFLNFKEIKIDMNAVDYDANVKSKMLKALDEYLKYGAMPEVVLADRASRFEILNSYYQTVVRRDIIERNAIKNEEALKALLRLLLNATSYSISKLYNTLKSLGYGVGKSTLQRYLSYIENSYFMFSVSIFSYKIKDQIQYPRKVYFIDNGFINRISTKFSNNYGRLYENIVALNLIRMTPDTEVYYWRQNHEEVDFVVKHDIKVQRIIQVCYDISDTETKNREIRALIKASSALRCKYLTIVTEDYENIEEHAWFGTKRRIEFVPLWKWLMNFQSP